MTLGSGRTRSLRTGVDGWMNNPKTAANTWRGLQAEIYARLDCVAWTARRGATAARDRADMAAETRYLVVELQALKQLARVLGMERTNVSAVVVPFSRALGAKSDPSLAGS